MLNEFQSISMEGLVFSLKGQFWIEESDGSKENLSLSIRGLAGREVEFAFQHLPDPNAKTRWGMGSCRWSPGKCPAGHHVNPTMMINLLGQGVISQDGKSISTQGGMVQIPWKKLNGHQCRIAMATCSFARESSPSEGADSLEARLGEIQNLMKNLSKTLGKK